LEPKSFGRVEKALGSISAEEQGIGVWHTKESDGARQLERRMWSQNLKTHGKIPGCKRENKK